MPVASRYQNYSAPANVYGGLTFGLPKYSPNDWSPRVGFAYSPGTSGTWSIRGGFSRAFDLSYANLTANSAPPYFEQTIDVNLALQRTEFPRERRLARQRLCRFLQTRWQALQARHELRLRRQAALWPYLDPRCAERVQEELHFEARYVGTSGVHLWNQSRLNISPLVNATTTSPRSSACPPRRLSPRSAKTSIK